MAPQLGHRFRFLVTWATAGRPRPERRHRRGRRPLSQAHPQRAPRPSHHAAVAPATQLRLVTEREAPQRLTYPTTPTLRHLGVVGLTGTVGAAAAMATARAAAERRFMGADPRARGARPRG
jgi:hypothetical protein